MSSILIIRDAPANSPTIPFTLSTSTSDPHGELAALLSGDLSEYSFLQTAPREILLSAQKSYKNRFHNAKAELKIVAAENEKLKHDQQTLLHAQIYQDMLTGKPWAVCIPFDLLTA